MNSGEVWYLGTDDREGMGEIEMAWEIKNNTTVLLGLL
jgi:hypothetical protein